MTKKITRNDIHDEYPLLKFSNYIYYQSTAVLRLGDEIINLLDSAFEDETINADWYKAYNKFWFWVLGSYEILRTMDQHSSECFIEAKRKEIKEHKIRIAELRISFTKLEIRGKKKKVTNENSVNHFDYENSDLWFRVENKTIKVREEIKAFSDFINSISSNDIINSYNGNDVLDLINHAKSSSL